MVKIAILTKTHDKLKRINSLLICDEITSSLDNKNKYEIINEINKLKQNLTVIFITHDETLKSYADNIINLNDEN